MQNLEKRKIPKRLHAYLPAKGSSIGVWRRSENLNKTAKCAPKYCRSIQISAIKDPRHLNAIKRIKKTVSVGQNVATNFQISRWRQILQNKFKTVLKIDGERPGEKWMWMNKGFSSIRFRSFQDVSYMDNKPEQGWKYLKISKNFFRFLPGMTKLKFLSITLCSKNHFFLLRKLNSMTCILNSLQGLQIISSSARENHLLPALMRIF